MGLCILVRSTPPFDFPSVVTAQPRLGFLHSEGELLLFCLDLLEERTVTWSAPSELVASAVVPWCRRKTLPRAQAGAHDADWRSGPGAVQHTNARLLLRGTKEGGWGAFRRGPKQGTRQKDASLQAKN